MTLSHMIDKFFDDVLARRAAAAGGSLFRLDWETPEGSWTCMGLTKESVDDIRRRWLNGEDGKFTFCKRCPSGTYQVGPDDPHAGHDATAAERGWAYRDVITLTVTPMEPAR